MAEIDVAGLRHRLQTARDANHVALDEEPVDEGKPGEDKPTEALKTYGRTPDGTVFLVPTTHDMVSQLLDPRQPKNLGDILVLAILALHALAAYQLSDTAKRPVFALLFLFWRAAYNIGIGALLTLQSKYRRLVTWAKRTKLFVHPDTLDGDGKPVNPRPWLYWFLKRELESKIPEDYEFEKAPIEYNTWLVFRRVVDLILMCDFVSYCLFALVCARKPEGEVALVATSRWLLGISLIGFNLWVKLDAHRVVKDYAWYWGDFFYLVDQELTFDGVFEMAPHPMYSIGYAGYYGISMMAASYDVLFISILAHLAQMAFLVIVENPHIEKTYNPPPPRRRTMSTEPAVKPTFPPGTAESVLNNNTSQQGVEVVDFSAVFVPGHQRQQASTSTPPSAPPPPPLGHELLTGVDLYRSTDYSVILLVLYLALLTQVTPTTTVYQVLFAVHALAWRVWLSGGLGLLLRGQSRTKSWTRHFVKYGEDVDEAWRQWKSLYHTSMVLCYASLMSMCWKLYTVPDDWSQGWILLRHVVGGGLVALQVWTAVSIYESLGEFGWFFGDFFYHQEAKLTYTSIYRFLNNPERVFGTAGVWGAALITWSPITFILALATQFLTIGFLALVEKPHMQKIYGRKLRREAGLTKFIKSSLPPPVQGWQRSVDRVLEETSRIVQAFLVTARPKLAGGVKTIVQDTSTLFHAYPPARLTLTRLPADLSHLPLHLYTLQIQDHEQIDAEEADDLYYADFGIPSGRSISSSSAVGAKHRLTFPYGAPIRVRWTAPPNHSAKDWIGVYHIADNPSTHVTEVSSSGRWLPTVRGVYDTVLQEEKAILSVNCEGFLPTNHVLRSDDDDENGTAAERVVEGEVCFHGDRLWWREGVYEFRYHHDGGHTVMAISQPFRVVVAKFDEYDDLHATLTMDPRIGHHHPGHLDGPGGGRPTVMQPVDDDPLRNPSWKSPLDAFQAEVERALFPVIVNCLDRDPDIAPSTVDEPFGALVARDARYAQRIVYAIHQMFGIEFATAVVMADGTCRKLAWRIGHAKAVLAPYRMSSSCGTTTPVAQ